MVFFGGGFFTCSGCFSAFGLLLWRLGPRHVDWRWRFGGGGFGGGFGGGGGGGFGGFGGSGGGFGGGGAGGSW
jgi:hypothetical protein